MSDTRAPPDTEAERRASIRAAGERARAEAEIRRRATQGTTASGEKGGRAGPEPTRYGDWEKGGLAIDF
jgi:hypothetical protein